MPGDIVFRISDLVGSVTALGVVVALVINLYTLRSKRRENDPWMIEMRGDVKHIRDKVDDQGIMLKRLDDRVDELCERTTINERDLKAVWRNIDELKVKK